MNPVLMALIIVSLTRGVRVERAAPLAPAASRRQPLGRAGRIEIGERLAAVWTFAFYQKKMRYYLAAGMAHQLIFLGFVVLLLRTLMLWGRGFDPTFNLFVLGHEPVLGAAARARSTRS